MHTVFFGIKRAHLEVVHRVAGPLLRGSELTPARFDLMRIVHLMPGVQQASIRWLLGVSAPTVSRMLRALEDLGLVDRAIDVRDRRCLVVRATTAGTAAVESALAATVTNREAEHVVARCATGDTMNAAHRGHDRRATATFIEAAHEKVALLGRVIACVRKALFDRAPYHHPWRTDGLTPYIVTTMVDGQLRYGNESLLTDDWLATDEWVAS